MTGKQLATLIVALVAALAMASAAAAGGEPKNVAPFTRSIGAAPQAQTLVGQGLQAQAANGEPKNQLPFSAPVVVRAAQTHSPDWFERYAAAHPYGQDPPSATVSPASPSGFRWHDALIGATAAALAIVALLASSLVFLRSRRRDHLAPATGS